jgi:hypothetical protein
MKEKWANKEAKVWFIEAQKWTQHSHLKKSQHVHAHHLK